MKRRPRPLFNSKTCVILLLTIVLYVITKKSQLFRQSITGSSQERFCNLFSINMRVQHFHACFNSISIGQLPRYMIKRANLFVSGKTIIEI